MREVPFEPSGTVLNGARLTAARLLWAGITLLTVGLFLAAVPAEFTFYRQELLDQYLPALRQVGISASFLAGYRTMLDVMEALAFALAGLFIFWRKSDDWMVMLISVGFTTFGSLFVPTLVRLTDVEPVFTAPVALVRAIGLATSLVAFYYLFPDGRFVPRWTRWLALGWAALTLIWLVAPQAPINLIYLDTWYNNIGFSFPLFLLWYGSGVAAQIYRYRKISRAIARQQTKWVVFGTTGAVVGFIIYYLPMVLIPEMREPSVLRVYHVLFGIPLFDIFVLMAPVATAISVLRYRLWDIDFLINRSLVYVILSGVLIATYFALVGVLSLIFWDASLDRQPVFISVIVTVLIAFLFSPVKARVQNIIDRRFYRRKYDADQALLKFGASVRGEVDLGRLSDDLL
ncbi:MAG TPA: hypothetical protein VHO48_09520, partial [Anaerolineaceae bacterium]|nr:hypothetical protein [Anaerolineaceae bacterium]